MLEKVRRGARRSALVAGLFVASFANAALAASEDANDAEAPPATLEIGNREIVSFRSRARGYTPHERAQAAQRRARAAYLANHHPKLTVKLTPDGKAVQADGQTLFFVTAADVDELACDTPDSVAHEAVERLRVVLNELDERDDPKRVGIGVGIAVLATLGWLLLLRLIVRLSRRVPEDLGQKVRSRLHANAPAAIAETSSSVLGMSLRALATILTGAAVLFLTFVWLGIVLNAVPYMRPWGTKLGGMVVGVATTIVKSALDALPGFLFVVAIFLVARLVARLGRRFLDGIQAREGGVAWLDQDTIGPTRMVFSLFVWLFALAMAYPYIPGSDSRAFQGVSVLFGLMMSVGASGTVGQALSGLILMYTRAYRVGEYVRINDTEGTVTALGLFTTRVRTGMGEEVVLPNVFVLGTTTKNYSRAIPGTGFVLDATVTIGYDTPWRQVHAMLIEAAGRVDAVATTPAPRVVQTALSDFYVEYRLIGYGKPEAPVPRALAISEVHAQIQDVFNEYGVQIMSPHYLGDPAEAKVVPVGKWAPAPATPLDADGRKGTPQ